jgi:hypothetical protein
MRQPDNKALAAPKLNVVAVNQPLGLLGGLSVVGANERFEPYKVPVEANLICAIIRHGAAPSLSARRLKAGRVYPVLQMDSGVSLPRSSKQCLTFVTWGSGSFFAHVHGERGETILQRWFLSETTP